MINKLEYDKYTVYNINDNKQPPKINDIVDKINEIIDWVELVKEVQTNHLKAHLTESQMDYVADTMKKDYISKKELQNCITEFYMETGFTEQNADILREKIYNTFNLN